MRKLIVILSITGLSFVISSCGVNYAYVVNQNQNSTQVELTEKNFNVVERVSGSADVTYVMFIGGHKKKQTYANAYAKMLEAAKLEGSSKAVINVVTEEHFGGFPPFFIKRTITVSGHVVEFTK